MNAAEILVFVKTDLQISTTAYDAHLLALIAAAEKFIGEEGITLVPSDAGDKVLVAMYAAYLWRKRRDNVPMPRMLRYALNNRLLTEKGAARNG